MYRSSQSPVFVPQPEKGATAEEQDPPRGLHLGQGRYRIDRAIGSGSTSTVFLGWDCLLEMPVAIKRLHQRHAARLRNHLVREVRVLREAAHPSLVRGYEYFEEGGLPCAVMEYLAGPTLGVALSESSCDRIVLAHKLAQVAWALGALHDLGFVHQDVQPTNVILHETRGAVLADFGSVTKPRRGSTKAALELVESTRYVAPEQLDRRGAVPSSDIYSLGLVVLETLADTQVPDKLRSLLLECLETSPSARPSARRLAQVLQDELEPGVEAKPTDAFGPPTLLITPDGSSFCLPHGEWVCLERRKPLQRLLRALARHRCDRPGSAISPSHLIEVGWPGELLLPKAAVNRMYVAISTLRSLGLGDLLERHGSGYRLSPRIPVRVEPR
ncbi:MAG: protein kinase [Deltaproteobacteria bacterium]|nr:protein kinase [Deltaproteobacteria bacterium]